MLNNIITLKESWFSERRTIYISGPMTGIENYNFPAFNAAEELLNKHYPNWNVVNPASFGDQTKDWEYNIKICLDAIKKCDTIYLLNGWENSRGAKKEIEEALRSKFLFMFEN